MIYYWLPKIFGCHCRADRSFYYKGRPFPLCARCTGEFVGIVFGSLLFFFCRLSVSTAIVVMIPMILDGFIQLLTRYESTNLKRFLTGFLFGIGLISLFLHSSIWAIEYGIQYGESLSAFI